MFNHKYISLAVCLLFSTVTTAQTIEKKKAATILGGNAQRSYISEVNNDGFRDLVVTQKVTEDSIAAFLFLQIDSLVFSLSDTLFNLASEDLFFSDIDNSGQMDLIVKLKDSAGICLTALLDFNSASGFQKALLYKSDSIEAFVVVDINNDGRKDILLTEKERENSTFKILLHKEDISFESTSEYPGVSHFLITSLNQDGYEDLVVFNSLQNEIIYLYNYNFEDWDTVRVPFEKNIVDWQTADINHDGRADIIISTIHENTPKIIALMNDPGGFTEREINELSSPISWFSVGDFTNDGFYDISTSSQILELDSLGEWVKNIAIDTTGFSFIRGMGDIDDDGDLDWIGFQEKNDTTEVQVFLNMPAEKNTGPLFVPVSYPVTIGDQTTFKWGRSVDDNTPSPAITYDFYLYSENEGYYPVTPDYDLINSPRLGARNFSRHGYTFFDTLATVNELLSGKYRWGVAGVDNAYYSETDITNCNGGTGLCVNSSFVSQCLEIAKEDTLVCVGDTLNLLFGTEEDSVVWASVKRGILGNENQLTFPVWEDDDVYAVAIPKKPCEDIENACIKNYALTIKTHERKNYISDPLRVCEDSVNYFTLDGEFDLIKWYTSTEILSDSNTFRFSLLTDSPIFLQLKESSISECFVYDTLVLEKPEKPDINLLTDEMMVCLNTTVVIDVNITDSLVSEIEYSLFANGAPLDIENPEITVSTSTTIIINAAYANCHALADTLVLTPVLPPTITVEGENQVFPGHSTRLSAHGATRYEWSPDEFIGSPQSATTNVFPQTTTLYTITGWDDMGCMGETTFRVEVIPSVYVPELFTPNGDGHNDLLVVHGSQIDHLEFFLFDGNGKTVYRTNSVPEITFYGWDGRNDGKPIAPGTYIWKIVGQFKNGMAITSEGKNSGEVKLVR